MSSFPDPNAFSPAESVEFQSLMARLDALEASVAAFKPSPVVPPVDMSDYVTKEQLAQFGIHI